MTKRQRDPNIYNGEEPISTVGTLPDVRLSSPRRSIWVRRARALKPSDDWSVYGPISESSSRSRIKSTLGEEFAAVQAEVRKVDGVLFGYLRIPLNAEPAPKSTLRAPKASPKKKVSAAPKADADAVGEAAPDEAPKVRRGQFPAQAGLHCLYGCKQKFVTSQQRARHHHLDHFEPVQNQEHSR